MNIILKKLKIQKSSFLYTLYKDNIQNAKEDIFNKSLYILENSIVNHNEKDFHITGDLNINLDKLNNNQVLLQFHSDENKNGINNSTCYIINESKSVTNKLGIKCKVNESFVFNIIDGYSKLSNGNLFVILKNIENKEEMDEIEPFNLRYYSQNSSGISTGAIIGIIIGGVVFICIIGTIIILCCKKRRKPNFVHKTVYSETGFEEKPSGNVFEVRFISYDQYIHSSIPCKREDNFSKLEEKLFQKYPELRYNNICYLHNASLINKSGTLIENRINNGDIIIVIMR